MLKDMKELFKEQWEHHNLIFRMAKFEVKGMYQIHYLGSIWQFINPIIQVGIYFVVFGIGLRGGRPIDGDIPFLLWLLMGLIPWFFISPTMVQGSNSIYQKVNLVSKMNFRVSLLPSIRIVGNSFQFLALLVVLFIITLLYGIFPSVQLLQLPYYLLSMYMFLFAFTIWSATIATLIRDYQN